MKFSWQELTYRLFSCAFCAALVLICSKCDYGHRYCSKEHSKQGRRQKHAVAQSNYQRDNHETWKAAHKGQQKSYRDRERERAQSGQNTVPTLQPVVAADDPQATGPSSSTPGNPAPEKVVVTGPLIPQTQQNEKIDPVTVTTPADLTEKGSARAADAVPCSSPATGADHGTQLRVDLASEREQTQGRGQADSGVTDQTLASPAAPVKVLVQAHPATGDTSERLIEARFRHTPMCCMFCDTVLALFAGIHVWPNSG
jgi:hypothetical protein